jgi:hypothetical protein
MQNPKPHDKCPIVPHQGLSPKSQDPTPKKVHFPRFVDETLSARLERLRSQITIHRELIACGGSVVASWKIHRGKRLGPYYRVAFRENRRQRARYIGSNEQLATMVRELIDELKSPRRTTQTIRRARAAVRQALRHSLAETESLVAPLGYRRRGMSFCKKR